MSKYTAVDLSKLPVPKLIDEFSFQTIFDAQRNQANGVMPLLLDPVAEAPVARDAELVTSQNGERYFKIPVGDDAGLMYLELPSEPAYKILTVSSYREMLIRQRINEAAMAVLPAFATDADLDAIGVRYDVYRLELVAADDNAVPPVAAVMESDAAFLKRILLAWEGLSTAGPEGAYLFHALSANSDVKDVGILAPQFSAFDKTTLSSSAQAELPAGCVILIVDDDAGLVDPLPGDLAINVVSNVGDGTADANLLAAVSSALSSKLVRPLTDNPIVAAANIVTYQIEAELELFDGVDGGLVLAASNESAGVFVEQRSAIGLGADLYSIAAALQVEGVYKVNLISPVADVDCLPGRDSAYCESITLSVV